MKELDNILNQIGYFQCKTQDRTISITGILVQEQDGIIFRGSTCIEHLRNLESFSDFQMWGKSNEIPLTLLDCRIMTMSATTGGMHVSVVVEPSEIIIGYSYIGNIVVKHIEASIDALNYMFTEKPLKIRFDFTREAPAVLNYTYPDKMKAHDKYGRLRIHQSFSFSKAWNSCHFDFLPTIEYDFHEPMPITEAVGHIAAVRNLFSFFSNYYLPLEKIKFSEKDSDREFCLFFNRSEAIDVPQEPFLIVTSDYAEQFTEIWGEWLELYDSAIPIPTLFYEIICSRATGINAFLNLAQAIEVYSCRYRENNAEEVEKHHNPKWNIKKQSIHLKSRIEDILNFLSGVLDLKDVNCLAKSLSDMRNYFTHYNDGRYSEPTYDDVLAASHFLRFVLLAIVYKRIGIRDEKIKDCTKRVAIAGWTGLTAGTYILDEVDAADGYNIIQSSETIYMADNGETPSRATAGDWRYPSPCPWDATPSGRRKPRQIMV